MIEAGYVHPPGDRYAGKPNVNALAKDLAAGRKGGMYYQEDFLAWERNLRRWLSGKPDPKTGKPPEMSWDKAEQVGRLLGKPADYFMLQTAIDELEAERFDLADRLGRIEERFARLERFLGVPDDPQSSR